MRCNMTKILRFSPLLLSLLLLACANVAPSAGRGEEAYWLKGSAARLPSPLDSALAYYAHARALTSAEWTRESELVKDALNRQPGEFNRLRQVLLLLSPAAPVRESPRVEPLLERLERDAQKNASPLLPLILLLRDDLRRLQEAEQRLEAQKAIEKDLLQKLEALKTIEKNMLDRQRAPQAVKKP